MSNSGQSLLTCWRAAGEGNFRGVGDRYLGRGTELGHLRDTHYKIVDLAVCGARLSFLGDWHWASMVIPELNRNPSSQMAMFSTF